MRLESAFVGEHTAVLTKVLSREPQGSTHVSATHIPCTSLLFDFPEL